MSSELIAAGSALLGALVGALSGIWIAVTSERRQARRESRHVFLTRFSEALEGDERKRVQITHKIMMATAASPTRIREWGRAGGADVNQLFQAMSEVLLDAVNEERKYQGREPLTNEELQALIPFGTRR